MVGMYYQLWSIEAGNRIADFKTEAEGLAMVRELLEMGWSADDLALGAFDEDEGPDSPEPPPALSGAELVARTLAVPPGSVPA